MLDRLREIDLAAFGVEDLDVALLLVLHRHFVQDHALRVLCHHAPVLALGVRLSRFGVTPKSPVSA
ncbi:hypothetical protein LP419_39410 [Massilia sp. H-1]|nr:hypothetical protein LP419_39410 [Massilia sp. H-1]